MVGLKTDDWYFMYCLFEDLDAKATKLSLDKIVRIEGKVDEIDLTGLTLTQCNVLS